MNAARAFELAGRAAKVSEIVTGHAHAAANAMAPGPVKDRAKVAIGEAKEVLGAFAGLTLDLMPFALEYDPAMPEAQLRAWAADLVTILRG